MTQKGYIVFSLVCTEILVTNHMTIGLGDYIITVTSDGDYFHHVYSDQVCKIKSRKKKSKNVKYVKNVWKHRSKQYCWNYCINVNKWLIIIIIEKAISYLKLYFSQRTSQTSVIKLKQDK